MRETENGPMQIIRLTRPSRSASFNEFRTRDRRPSFVDLLIRSLSAFKLQASGEILLACNTPYYLLLNLVGTLNLVI